MSKTDKILKRIFDLFLSLFGLIVFGWLIVLAALLARLDTRLSGFFLQKRVGQYGEIFNVYKIRTMKNLQNISTTVSVKNDPRITKLGRFWRKTKIDELPQLINVLKGDMSFVGPRPDVPGFADMLTGEDRIILSVKPGITGPASIYFKNEEEILAGQSNPEQYNLEVIWPKKIEINKKYINNFSLLKDVFYIFKTVT